MTATIHQITPSDVVTIARQAVREAAAEELRRTAREELAETTRRVMREEISSIARSVAHEEAAAVVQSELKLTDSQVQHLGHDLADRSVKLDGHETAIQAIRLDVTVLRAGQEEMGRRLDRWGRTGWWVAGIAGTIFTSVTVALILMLARVLSRVSAMGR